MKHRIVGLAITKENNTWALYSKAYSPILRRDTGGGGARCSPIDDIKDLEMSHWGGKAFELSEEFKRNSPNKNANQRPYMNILFSAGAVSFFSIPDSQTRNI